MKNYYEILQVSEKASPEIIEKAYKVLAKKYHPDLQEAQNKDAAEEKMKELNEAYEILSNKQKRAELDTSLQEERDRQSRINTTTQPQVDPTIRYYQPIQQRQQTQKQEPQTNSQTVDYQKAKKYNEDLQRKYEEKLKQEMEREYQRQYYSYLRSLGYKIKEKWTWKKTLNFFIAITIMMAIITLLWLIPTTRNLMISFYESNPILQGVVNVFINIVNAVGSAIGKLFTNPPEL